MQRKSPLKRSTKSLRRSKLKPVSTKRAGQLREYAKLRKQFLEDHPFCQVAIEEHAADEAVIVRIFKDCSALLIAGQHIPRATEIHHKNKRRGAMLNDTKHWMAVCRENHERIENNKAWARSKGYLKDF